MTATLIEHGYAVLFAMVLLDQLGLPVPALPIVIAAGGLAGAGVLAAVTIMTERRMLADPTRSELFRAYQQRTSVWLPWPPSRRLASDQGE
jgi:protein-S-isoprenylcysteine O-methyltransferase Ste14